MPATLRLVLQVALVAMLAVGIGAYSASFRSRAKAPEKGLYGAQSADPPGPVISTRPGAVVIFPTALQRAVVPVAKHFTPPLGTAEGGLCQENAQGLLRWCGTEQASLGAPVLAVAEGLVVYRGNGPGDMGHTVVLFHRTADGRELFSIYGGLLDSQVAIDQLLARGHVLGRLGNADGRREVGLEHALLAGPAIELPVQWPIPEIEVPRGTESMPTKPAPWLTQVWQHVLEVPPVATDLPQLRDVTQHPTQEK